MKRVVCFSLCLLLILLGITSYWAFYHREKIIPPEFIYKKEEYKKPPVISETDDLSKQIIGDLSKPIDSIVIHKSTRRLILFRDKLQVKIYKIALGRSPTGNKIREGDNKTPEGTFKINKRNDKSAFHLSLGIDYPTPEDIARARAGGYSPGGDIFIHGQPNSWKGGALSFDWTAGCIALSNQEIEELWRIVPIGTQVEIRP